MDKRIIWFALIVLMAVASIFFFRYGCRKHSDKVLTPRFSIDNQKIFVGDSIYFEDKTDGATSWFWDFGDGMTSIQQKGYHPYFENKRFNVKLTINGKVTDSSFFVTVDSKEPGSEPIPDRIIVDGPTTAYVGEPITFTDKTPGANHTNWQNLVSAEIKRDSKTYTTTFNHPGNFTIIATNEKNTSSSGQGIIKGKIINRPVIAPQPAPAPSNKPKPVAAAAPAAPKPATVVPAPVVKPAPPGKQSPTNDQLKALFNYIVTGKETFSEKYKPIKDNLKDESIPVSISGNKSFQKSLYGFCYYLQLTKARVADVKTEWDPSLGFIKIMVIVDDK